MSLGGFFGRMFGTDEAIKSGIGMMRDGLDALVYTKEEKASDAAAAVTEARAMLVRWMEATQGQNIARRFLAVVITMLWLFMYLLAAALDFAAPWINNPDTAFALAASAQAVGTRAHEMNGAMMLILGFYFAAPHMSGIVQAAMQRFGGGEKRESVK